MAYVDTNVILAKYFPEDKQHAQASNYIEMTDKRKIISPISVVELSAVLSRLENELLSPRELLQESPKRRIRALTEFIIRDCGLLLLSIPSQVKIRLAGTVLSVPIEYQGCIRLASTLKMKTLDLLHLAYADNLRKWGHDLELFVTGDKNLLSNSEKIERELGIKVMEPSKIP
jgi:predicted nucleic acid-binding protein